MNNSFCPCGSPQPYSQCCEPFIKKSMKPQTAEQLMRSRFSAFCLSEHQYLVDTHHPSQREINELRALQESKGTTHWIKLIIHQTQQDSVKSQTARVEFSAFFNEKNQFFELREMSNFIQDRGQWFYLDGNPSIQPADLKLKRNDSCWCKSGKKLKHCHSL